MPPAHGPESWPASSANLHDSLTDVYLVAGKKDLARMNAQKALERLPSDQSVPADFRNRIRESAEQKLKLLDGRQ